ncbi:MAG TPA: hypothetical protein VH254_03700 [Candidatus Udaeobacter sp.]|jgi:hypothetical protein|nr:hypothetical protein [Candidatus Udaeobacter sp.]
MFARHWATGITDRRLQRLLVSVIVKFNLPAAETTYDAPAATPSKISKLRL